MKDKIIEILKNACALEEEIAEESELKLLSLDSLSFIEALVKIEETFGIEFDICELNFNERKTAGDIIACAEKKADGKK